MAATAAYTPIQDYGVIGDLYTVALIGNDGSLDFMCFPHFDSPTIFASLLDAEKGGKFQICPVSEGWRQKKQYLPNTNVLISRFFSQDGVAELSDFMPVEEAGHSHAVVRRVKAIRGESHFRMICDPRFDYARVGHRAENRENEVLFVSQGPQALALRLRSSVPIAVVNGAAVAEFKLAAGSTASFVLELVNAGQPSPSENPDFVPHSFKETVNFWRRWVSRSTYAGRWREMVNRSALTLKLLTSRVHGSIIAAPTFGLPEVIGGVRNWDYRYTWIRDASFTLYALMRLGFTDEASAFMRWFEARCGEIEPGKPLQIMYGLDGRRTLTEEELPHLSGYMGSRPVRIGNAAHDQLQLDIFGELMDSVYFYDRQVQQVSHEMWSNLVTMLNWVCKNWRLPDEGIWEVRGGRHEFFLSRVMCWVALDRAVRLSTKRGLPGNLTLWITTRDEIYHDIHKNFWSEERRTFVQYKGAKVVDAASLIMPLVRCISPTDPRWLSTMEAIRTDLLDDSLVYRYRPEQAASDGLAGEEGTFCMCSFWYAECLSRAGDLESARLFFEKMLGYANRLGLYAEELGPTGEYLGNFPQAFTHLALISTAFDIDRRLNAAGIKI